MPEDLEEEKYPLPDLPHGYRWKLWKDGDRIYVALQRKGAFRWKSVETDYTYTFYDQRHFQSTVRGVLEKAIEEENDKAGQQSPYPLGIHYGKKEE
jgi:hypothetical protein